MNRDHITIEQLATNGENWKQLDEWIGNDEMKKSFVRFHIEMTTPVFGLYGYTIRKCFHQKDEYWKLPKSIVEMVIRQGHPIPAHALRSLIAE